MADPYAGVRSALAAQEVLEICDSFQQPWKPRLNPRGRQMLDYLRARRRRRAMAAVEEWLTEEER